MDYSEEKFKEHLQKIVSASNPDSDRPLTRDELKQLAISMGMDESKWESLMIQAQSQLDLALNHLKVRNYSDAIKCAEEATSIDPYIKDGNAVLAQAYFKLAKQERNTLLFEKAEQAARMELVNDPMDSVATNILGELENRKNDGKFNFQMTKKLAIFCGILLLLFIILYMCNSAAQRDNVDNIIQNSNQNISTSSVDAAKGKWENAVQRRNNHLLGLAPQSKSIEDELVEAISDYDFSKKDEQHIQILIGKLKAEAELNSDELATLEGNANRIGVEYNRYIEAISAYNSSIDDESKKLTLPN